jgi:hypothetical protein
MHRKSFARNKPARSKKLFLPRSFEDSGNQALVGHFAKAKPGHLEFAKRPAAAASKLAAVAKAHFRRIFWHFVESIDSDKTLFDRPGKVEDQLLQLLPFGPFIFHHFFASLLLRDPSFGRHGNSLFFTGFFTGRPFLALLPVGIFLVNHIYAPLTTNNLVALAGVRLDRSSDFHSNPQDRKLILYPSFPFAFKPNFSSVRLCNFLEISPQKKFDQKLKRFSLNPADLFVYSPRENPPCRIEYEKNLST